MTPQPAAAPALTLPGPGGLTLLLALAGLFLGLTVLIAAVLGLMTRSQRPDEVIRRRLSVYTITGRKPAVQAQPQTTTLLGESAMARSAVELANRVAVRQGFDEALAARLESAGLPLRSAEWLLLHVGTALAAALLLLLLSGGAPAAGFLGLLLGGIGPWLVITIRQGRRTGAFLEQLPDTLQLLSGSLKAGYSMAQAIDSVVREARPPISTEFNRALVESRLGVPIETALEGVAERMRSRDFGWAVMAIRIQREVGGNLAELLSTVAETLRERERLRRQVLTLSAEGRLSAWILGALPIVFALYLTVVQPAYIARLASPLGLVLVGLAVALLAVGVFWLSRVVRVEV